MKLPFYLIYSLLLPTFLGAAPKVIQVFTNCSDDPGSKKPVVQCYVYHNGIPADQPTNEEGQTEIPAEWDYVILSKEGYPPQSRQPYNPNGHCIAGDDDLEDNALHIRIRGVRFGDVYAASFGEEGITLASAAARSDIISLPRNGAKEILLGSFSEGVTPKKINIDEFKPDPEAVLTVNLLPKRKEKEVMGMVADLTRLANDKKDYAVAAAANLEAFEYWKDTINQDGSPRIETKEFQETYLELTGKLFELESDPIARDEKGDPRPSRELQEKVQEFQRREQLKDQDFAGRPTLSAKGDTDLQRVDAIFGQPML